MLRSNRKAKPMLTYAFIYTKLINRKFRIFYKNLAKWHMHPSTKTVQYRYLLLLPLL